MDKKKAPTIRDWVEPAHPSVVQLYDDLISIYTRIRDKFQPQLDNAFDRISRKIGFVVTTTVPVALEVSDKGVVRSIRMGADNLKGTLFDQELSKVLKPLVGSGDPDGAPALTAGNYNIYILWHDALKLKLRTDWLEPAHFIPKDFLHNLSSGVEVRVRPEVMEPVHWFDPGQAISVEDAVLVQAIDEVYPGLRLATQIATYRDILRKKIRPEVMEPVHFSKTNVNDC